jgi:hypothetical protein
MGLAKSRAIMEAVTQPEKLSKIKDKQEKRFRIEDAARTFERFAEIKREIKTIKADPELFEASQALLTQKIADMKAAKKS